MVDDRIGRINAENAHAILGAALFILCAGASTPALALCRDEEPTVVDLSTEGGRTYFEFAEDEDVVFLGDDEVRETILRVQGGRDITILGGAFVPGPEDSAATINVQGITGDLLIEGVRIDNAETGERDGIAVAGREGHAPAVVLRDTRVENVEGSFDGVHGDIFQAYGPIASLTVERFTGSSSYQGFFLDPQHEPLPERVTLTDVNLRPIPSETSDLQPKLLWFYGEDAPQTYPVELTNVRIDGRTVEEASGNLFPPNAEAEEDGLAWAGLPIVGRIATGAADDLDFAEVEAVGEGFDARAALDRLIEECPL